MESGGTDIQLVLAEMQNANALTAELVAAQLITQAAQEAAAIAARETAIDAKKASDYAEQRLAIERGFFMDVGAVLIENRATNELVRQHLAQTPLSGALEEFTSGAERAVRHISYQLEIVLRFMQSAIPHLSTMEKKEREHLSRQLKEAVNAPRLESLQAQRREWQVSLNTLLEQEAVYGGTPPVDLVNRLGRARLRLEELEAEMESLK